MSHIDIKGLDKAAVLAALYNASTPQGRGFLRADPSVMTVDDARQVMGRGDDHAPALREVQAAGGMVVNRKELYFDYVKGRPLKVDLTGDSFDPWLFDRDAGPGKAFAAIAELRASLQT